jgi:hypothetical protein
MVGMNARPTAVCLALAFALPASAQHLHPSHQIPVVPTALLERPLPYVASEGVQPAYDWHYEHNIVLGYPMLDTLRTHPRFVKLMARMGLPPARGLALDRREVRGFLPQQWARRGGRHAPADRSPQPSGVRMSRVASDRPA